MVKVLVVEDEPGIAFSLESDLQTEGYEVVLVADGAEAVPRALSQPFDLILLDVMLPNKDGFEVCRELRHRGLKTPIILLTSKTQEAEKVMGLDVGADDYVTKPFSPRELRARIRALLRRASPGPANTKMPATDRTSIASAPVNWTSAVLNCAAMGNASKPQPRSSSCWQPSSATAAACFRANAFSTKFGARELPSPIA